MLRRRVEKKSIENPQGSTEISLKIIQSNHFLTDAIRDAVESHKTPRALAKALHALHLLGILTSESLVIKALKNPAATLFTAYNFNKDKIDEDVNPAIVYERLWEGNCRTFKHDSLKCEQESIADQALHAAKTGNIDELTLMSAQGVDLTQLRSTEGHTLLHAAASTGQVNVLTLLKEKMLGADIRNIHGETAAFAAAANGQLISFDVLDQMNADYNIPTNIGVTAVYIASANGYPAIIERLHHGGADLDLATTDTGETPLIIAASIGQIASLQMLITLRAKLDKPTKDGLLPIHFAAINRQPEVINVLKIGQADIDAQSPDGNTAAIIAAEEGYFDVIATLIKLGADMKKPRPNGEGPIFAAVRNQHVVVVNQLVAHGVDVDTVQQHNGATPLLLAILLGHTKVVECLLQHLKAAKVDNLTFLFTPHALLALAKECRDVRAMVGVTQLLCLKEPFVYQGEKMISITLAEITAAMRNKQIFDILERPTSDDSLAASTRSRYPAGSFFKPLHSDITNNLWVSSQYYQFSRYNRSTTQHEEDEVHGLTLSLGRAMG